MIIVNKRSLLNIERSLGTMEKEAKRLLRKLIRLFAGDSKKAALKYIDEVAHLDIVELNHLAKENPAMHLSAEIFSDMERDRKGEEPRFFTRDGDYIGLCVEEYHRFDLMTRQQRYVLSWAFGMLLFLAVFAIVSWNFVPNVIQKMETSASLLNYTENYGTRPEQVFAMVVSGVLLILLSVVVSLFCLKSYRKLERSS